MKVVIPTSTRADFGLLTPLIQTLESDPSFDVYVFVTGSHLSSSYGDTYEEIEASGVRNIRLLDVDISDTTPVGTVSVAAETMQKFAVRLEAESPDLVIILGDRYEMLAVAMSAFLLKIPIAHISGGDLTIGALDDCIRHSITKLSVLHFTTTEAYRKRVIQLGERPDRVFNVGNLCIDNFKSITPLSRREVSDYLDFDLAHNTKNMLVTLHPETTTNDQKKITEVFFDAVLSFKNMGIVITYPNHDSGSEYIIKKIENISKAKFKNVCIKKSLGMARYHSILNYIDVVVGNSSSGVTEVPSYKVPSIDVGDRQKGRVRAESVLHAEYDRKDLRDNIDFALTDTHKGRCFNSSNPYGDGDTAEKIMNILKATELSEVVIKEFYDYEK